MVSFQKALWRKIAVAGHGTRYLFRLTFSRIISIFAILLSQCLFAKRIEKKNSHNSDDSLPINCLSSANQQCVQPASVTVFFKFSKLSVNPSWMKWCIFKTSQRSHSLERAEKVKFFPQWSGEGQKYVGRDPFNQHSDPSDREKRTTSKGGPVFSKLFRLDRTDPLSFGPKFPEILVEWIAPAISRNYIFVLHIKLSSARPFIDW